MINLVNIPISERPFEGEYFIQTSRSSGPGGQHVNKTETKVELRFHIGQSLLLSANEKKILHEKLKNRINNEGYLVLHSQKYRSQLKNREDIELKFIEIISKSLKRKKKRIATKPSRSAVEKRIQGKKNISEKKVHRTKVRLDGE